MNNPNQPTGNPVLPVNVLAPQIGTLQDVQSKKRCLQNLSKLLMVGIQEQDLVYLGEDFDPLDIFDALFEREQLGSTGIGDGCAIPHGRISGLRAPQLAVLTLAKPIEFNAIDNKPVDILIGLLAPTTGDSKSKADEHHLQLLAVIATLLSKKENRNYLRKEMTPRNLQAFLDDKLQLLWDKEVSS